MKREIRNLAKNLGKIYKCQLKICDEGNKMVIIILTFKLQMEPHFTDHIGNLIGKLRHPGGTGCANNSLFLLQQIT